MNCKAKFSLAPECNLNIIQNHNDATQRAAMINLAIQIRKTASSSFFPPQLVSNIEDVANKNAQESSLSSSSSTSYDKVISEMADFMLQCVSSSMKNSNEKRMTSDEAYTAALLDTYDTLVWGFNSPFLWQISEKEVHDMYTSMVSRNHCEIAVGTGYFLSKEVSKQCKSITLVDLNENSLKSCETRIQNLFIDTIKTNIDGTRCSIEMPEMRKIVADITLNPADKEYSLSHLNGKFHSVSANFLFHCLHGSSLRDKFYAFHNCAQLLDPEIGVFFGSTILGKEMIENKEKPGIKAIEVLEKFNKWGVFGNLGDSFSDLESVLKDLFHDVKVERVGYCGVWTAKHPKQNHINKSYETI